MMFTPSKIQNSAFKVEVEHEPTTDMIKEVHHTYTKYIHLVFAIILYLLYATRCMITTVNYCCMPVHYTSATEGAASK